MKLNPQKKIIYLISNGATSSRTTPLTEDYSQVLHLVEAAVAAGIDLFQLREKLLSAKVLYALSNAAARITRGSATKLLVNDRADIAAATGADGVHLTTHSLSPEVIRHAFGDQFLVGVSTHSLAEAASAAEHEANFVVLGPIFATLSKRQSGEPLGLNELQLASSQLAPFPVLALGGISLSNVAECIGAGASGIAAISLLNHPADLKKIAGEIRSRF